MKFNKNKALIIAPVVLACLLTSISTINAMKTEPTAPEQRTRAVAAVTLPDSDPFSVIGRASSAPTDFDTQALQWLTRYIGEAQQGEVQKTLEAQRKALRKAPNSETYNTLWQTAQTEYTTLHPLQRPIVNQRFQKRVQTLREEAAAQPSAASGSGAPAPVTTTTTTATRAVVVPQTQQTAAASSSTTRRQPSQEEASAKIQERKASALRCFEESLQRPIHRITDIQDQSDIARLVSQIPGMQELWSSVKPLDWDIFLLDSPPSAQRTEALKMLRQYTIETLHAEPDLQKSGWKQGKLEILETIDVPEGILTPQAYKPIFIATLSGIYAISENKRSLYAEATEFFQARKDERIAMLSGLKLREPTLSKLVAFLSQHNWDVVLPADPIYPEKMQNLKMVARLAANALDAQYVVDNIDEENPLVTQLRQPDFLQTASEPAGYNAILHAIAEAYQELETGAQNVFENLVGTFFLNRQNS